MKSSPLEDLSKDVFQYMILAGDLTSKDILNLYNLTPRLKSKCTDDLFRILLQRLRISYNFEPETVYIRFVTNPLVWMLLNYPTKKWNWHNLSKNSAINPEFVRNNLNLPWDWKGLSSNPSINIDFVLENIDKLNIALVSANPAIDWHDIINHTYSISIGQWNFGGLSENPNITWKIIQDNPDCNWSWYGLSINPNITPDIVTSNPLKVEYREYGQPKRTNEWHWGNLSQNPSIDIKFVKSNLDKKWNWYNLSKNPAITWQDIIDNPSLNWEWNGVSSNPNITMDIVKKYPCTYDRRWNWNNLTANPALKWDDIKGDNGCWTWDGRSKNPNVTWEIVQICLHDDEYKDGWNWQELSSKIY